MSWPPERAEAEEPAATLRDVLQLEQQRGFNDRTVVGGLARLVERLGPQLPLDGAQLERLRAYPQLSLAQRRAAVSAALTALASPAPTAPGTAPRSPHGPEERDQKAGRSRPAGPSDSRQGMDASQRRPGPGRDGPAGSSRSRSGPGLSRSASPLSPSTPLAALPGVGPARAKRLAVLGLRTAADLRSHLPHRYLWYPPPRPASHLGFEELASFEGTVIQLAESPLPGNRRRITAWLRDETGTVAVNWIRGGRTPLGLREGMRLALSGPLIRVGRQITFENPDYEPADRRPLHTRRPVPVYPLTSGISQLFLRSLIRQTLDRLPPPDDPLPAWLREQERLLDLAAALECVHAPDTEADVDQARRRLAFDELLPIELLVLGRRRQYQELPATPLDPPWPMLAELRRQLPFALTRAQQRALSTLLSDLAATRPMLRLLQGDVGSGKTVVAAMALLVAAANGRQSALLAPTEILAEQHYRTLSRLYGDGAGAIAQGLGHPVRLQLLSGALTRKEREQALAAIRAGEVDIVVGTHALIQGDVEFADLALAVVDEQHRFGVEQRVALRRKGVNPHLLVMTATPIPRTLALTVYGDLDLTVIDELPPGRQPVETILLQPQERVLAYQQVRAEVEAGHQAFVICPLVEGSAVVQARAAVTEYQRLQHHELAGLRLALLHGRMRPQEKDRVMREFADGHSDVLVSTPVVEVGVDVPNATVMLIEGADRFGLAQLHQFRGRIGRGTAPAKCFLVAEGEAAESLARLEALAASTNGMELAEADLQIRGPGDYFGVRQSGFPALRVADLTNVALVQQVRAAAARILAEDPDLTHPHHAGLASAVRALADEVLEAN